MQETPFGVQKTLHRMRRLSVYCCIYRVTAVFCWGTLQEQRWSRWKVGRQTWRKNTVSVSTRDTVRYHWPRIRHCWRSDVTVDTGKLLSVRISRSGKTRNESFPEFDIYFYFFIFFCAVLNGMCCWNDRACFPGLTSLVCLLFAFCYVASGNMIFTVRVC